MKCSSCGFGDTKVVDSRVSDGGCAIRRRRECEGCGFRFTTFERGQTSSLVVQKKDGTTEPYDRAKLEKGVFVACGKRPLSIDQVRERISALEERWSRDKVVKTSVMGGDVVEMLREVDEIAYIRFASVYKQFKDVESCKEEMAKILG